MYQDSLECTETTLSATDRVLLDLKLEALMTNLSYPLSGGIGSRDH